MTKRSPLKTAPAGPFPYVQAASAIIGLLGGQSAKRKQREEIRLAEQALSKEKDAWLRMNITNPYAGMTNYFKGMENVMEDLTVNQKQVEYLTQQSERQRADIMSGLRGAAGASGIAGMAQTLAQQGQMQAQQMSAMIGQQESANQRLVAQQKAQLQNVEAQAQMQIQAKERYGAMLQEQRQMERQEMLLTMAYGRATAARQASNSFTDAIIGGMGSAVGGWAQRGFGGMTDINKSIGTNVFGRKYD